MADREESASRPRLSSSLSIDISQEKAQELAKDKVTQLAHSNLQKVRGGLKIAIVALVFSVTCVCLTVAYWMRWGCYVLRNLLDADWEKEAYETFVKGVERGRSICATQYKQEIISSLTADDYMENDLFGFDDQFGAYTWVACHLPGLSCSDYDEHDTCPDELTTYNNKFVG